ncbi:DUF3301 domain-containing protein [Kangiella sediminilitoris]|uniref:DUF3301 domain-containing protein n=1 Tax=Kangiella sediminilitoris TaxID=1144748 RepID=A0A1B3B8H8_9GAMM|nr:DUF3301 domain-containing protein [Kangiella sediminilitoris]AOE49103.1 hypothetical protein KS2013_378 [Kangiella sediminilitoris]
MSNLLVILFIALIIGFWVYNRRIQENAFKAAQKACQDAYVQNLDGYVALKKIYFDRDSEGKIRFLRRYQFEFATDGAQRYVGFVVMQGKWPVIVEMEST